MPHWVQVLYSVSMITSVLTLVLSLTISAQFPSYKRKLGDGRTKEHIATEPISRIDHNSGGLLLVMLIIYIGQVILKKPDQSQCGMVIGYLIFGFGICWCLVRVINCIRSGRTLLGMLFWKED